MFNWFTQLVILEVDLDPGVSDSKARVLHHLASLLRNGIADAEKNRNGKGYIQGWETIPTGLQWELHFSSFSSP